MDQRIKGRGMPAAIASASAIAIACDRARGLIIMNIPDPRRRGRPHRCDRRQLSDSAPARRARGRGARAGDLRRSRSRSVDYRVLARSDARRRRLAAGLRARSRGPGSLTSTSHARVHACTQVNTQRELACNECRARSTCARCVPSGRLGGLWPHVAVRDGADEHGVRRVRVAGPLVVRVARRHGQLRAVLAEGERRDCGAYGRVCVGRGRGEMGSQCSGGGWAFEPPKRAQKFSRARALGNTLAINAP